MTQTTPAPQPPRFLDRFRAFLEGRHHPADRRQAWAAHVRDFILFHDKRHPQELGPGAVLGFLAHLARPDGADAATQAQAREALNCLYQDFLPTLAPAPTPPATPAPGGSPFLNRVREILRSRGYALDTEKAYLAWIRRFILFHGKRHPQSMGGAEVDAFLTHLAVTGRVATSTQNQALNALVFLYDRVLNRPLGTLSAVRARRPERLPIVLSVNEVRQVLARVTGFQGVYLLMCQLMYGAGLRVKECCRLRVKDVDFERHQLLIRGGKGNKDRVGLLPRQLHEPLARQIGRVRETHAQDLARGLGTVELPDALGRKYPGAGKELGWQFLFPSRQVSRDPRSSAVRRHHLHKTALQRAVRRAVVAAGLTKHATAHTFRHSFATHLLEAGYDVCTIQRLMGHSNIQTTMRYLHLMDKGAAGVRSPFDALTAPPPQPVPVA